MYCKHDYQMDKNKECNSLVKQDLLNTFPEWWKDINAEDYYLVMTDDCDSLFSCQRLHTLFNIEVGGFYSFDSGLWLNEEIADWKTPIYVDLSIGQNQLCFDNHRTFLKNPNRVNPNNIPRRYYEKYNFGTLALIAALYGGVSDMDEEQKTLLIAVDGGFIGYYRNNGRWKDVNLYWLDKLGLTKYLVPILEKHDMKYFQDFSVDYGLYDKILISKDGFLETPTYSVPQCQFDLVQPVEKVFTNIYDATKRFKNNENIWASAETYQNKYVLNIAT